MTVRRISSIFLVITLVASSFVMSFGSIYQGGNPTTQENINITCAYTLHDMGLFQGTDNGFELDKQATRIQGIAMFVRILGQENTALAAGTATTFTDVPNWAKAYTAYAEKQGLSNGLGNGKFGSDNIMSAKDYATFLLRGLGYSDSNGDFTYAESIDYLNQIGVISEDECNYLKNCDFKRGEMALMSYRALCSNSKGTNTPLVEKLGLGTVLESNLQGSNDDGSCDFKIQFNNLSKINGVNKIYYEPLGYSYPLDNCFTYRQLSKDFGEKRYTSVSEISNMKYGAVTDNGIQGSFTHGMVFCDASGNELGMIRLYASQENQDMHKEKIIVTPFPQKFKEPLMISDGVTYDKSSGIITLDKQKITAQIGAYSKIYSTWINYTDISSIDGYTPKNIVGAMNGRNGIKTYNSSAATISVDASKYYQLLLFMDAAGNPIGCKALDK